MTPTSRCSAAIAVGLLTSPMLVGWVNYLGERLNEYSNGQVVGDGGQWLAGEGQNQPGVFMPADPKVGDQFEQERAPGIAEDTSKVIVVGETVDVPAETASGCIKT